ncbi:MAG: AAA family ATPase [Anaerolineae bacterium]|nr:AAA family ATPase [Anaerolineae bacterium]
MRLKLVKISNYRNLDGVEITFSPKLNFLIGENNLGKSNFLNLLNTLFTKRGFSYDDFSDPDEAIEIEFTLILEDVELGVFEDLFNPENENQIDILAVQETPEGSLEFWHQETSTKISVTSVRAINYIHYDSLRNPSSELNFDRNRGVGKFLNFLIQRSLEDEEEADLDFVDKDRLNGLISSVNDVLQKLKSFRDFSINATLEEEANNLLSRLILLTDGEGRELNQSGYGVQFLSTVSLAILGRLLTLSDVRWRNVIFENEETGENYISLLLGLDEPEIHQHPYMQRSLIKYLSQIISNNEADFLKVIKHVFDVDGFVGQCIVVSHSPNVLLNDFTEIVRFYKCNNRISVKSGTNIVLDEQKRAHLLKNFPFVKEAFFSRCVIIVEGDSEIAALPLFAGKMDISDLDDLGISIIQAGGIKSVLPLMKLLENFGINSVGVIDSDDATEIPANTFDIFVTTERDFEAELVTTLLDNNKETLLIKILEDYDTLGQNRFLKSKILNECKQKYSITPSNFSTGQTLANISLTDTNNRKVWYLTWFIINKGILLGRTVGELLGKDDIPMIYQNAIKKAIELTQNNS